MTIKFIEFNNKKYPFYQSEGFSSQFIFPFATKICKGKGYDIGCSKKEWALPNSIPIDIKFEDGMDAFNLPNKKVDYIFSSHCLEHIINWHEAIDYWISKIEQGGILFLYLPDYSQEYWRPWNCKKYVNYFTSNIIQDFLKTRNVDNILVSGVDLNNSFAIVCEIL